jgi:hypothetical protein
VHDFLHTESASSDVTGVASAWARTHENRRLRVTERAKIQEPVQRQQHLVAILAAGLLQMTKIDQSVDKRFGQVDGNASRTSRWRRCDRYMRGLPASTVVDPATR